jgi:hypothetical protein
MINTNNSPIDVNLEDGNCGVLLAQKGFNFPGS